MKKILLIFCLFASIGGYAQEPVSILQSINISTESGSAIIGLNFNGPVSFTSMKLTNPFRIVLDFTDCKKGGSVKNSIKVNSNGIKEISISQMGSNDAPTLRVTIVTGIDLEFNVEPTDNGINVRIVGVKLASADSSEEVSDKSPKVVEVTPKQQEEVRPEPQSEPAPAPVVAERKAEPEPEPAPAPVLAETKVEPQVEPTPAKKEKKPKFKEAPAMVASNDNTPKVEHFTPPVRKKSSQGRNILTWLGFQVSATGSRIFIKTIDEAEYSLKEKDDKTLILEIYNTDIPKKNNRRHLDTSFFNSPVAYISPKIEGGSMKVVKIEIKLKQRVPFVTKQESNALYVDFEGIN